MLEDYRNLKEDFEKSQREIEDLRGQLREAKTGQEKNQVREIIGRNEKQFQSTQLVEKGLKLFLDKDYDTAIATLKDALEMDQDNAGAYGMLGIAYWAQGKDTLAIGYLSKAIERKPKIIQAYLFRGIIYRDRRTMDLSSGGNYPFDRPYRRFNFGVENIKITRRRIKMN